MRWRARLSYGVRRGLSCGLLLAFACGTPLWAEVSAPPRYGSFLEVNPTEVHPAGWLAEMLHRQAEGLAKHHAISGYPFDSCLWTGVIPRGGTDKAWKAWWPYEQTGYLIDGLERLGLVTGDAAISGEADSNITFILSHPAPDGSLGPTHIGETNWPQAVVFRALMASYAAHPDPAIVDALRKHFLSKNADFGKGRRDVCNVEAILWTYAQTGDIRLLDLAKRTYDNFNQNKPTTGLSALSSEAKVIEHGVTFNETAKLPALLYLATGDPSLLAASVAAYQKIDRDHMMAGGMHTAEEKLDGADPWRYTETCDVSDYTWSVGYLLMASGDATWADHIEKAVFNAGLGAITKDFKAHQYFSAPNQVIATSGICKRFFPDRLQYRPGHDVECCTGNVERFLPNYALRQWMRTPDGGVVAAMYGPSQLTTHIGPTPVSIEERTQYPFAEDVTFVVHTPKAVSFPLVLRVPEWTSAARLTINGNEETPLPAGAFKTIQREFVDGDTVKLQLPMTVKLRPGAPGYASVERGPLVYSLKIDEQATPVTGFKATAEFPAWDKRPASPWNYALNLSGPDAAAQVKVIKGEGAACPWDTMGSPITLRAPARRIVNWGLTAEGGNPGFPSAPKLAGDTETVTLVPYGSTCLRLTVFPLVTPSGDE